MTIEWRRLTMCGPSSVGDAGMGHKFLVHIDVLFIDEFPQGHNFADLLKEVNFILAVAVNGHTS